MVMFSETPNTKPSGFIKTTCAVIIYNYLLIYHIKGNLFFNTNKFYLLF
jgi:hypothetical protein